MHIPLLNEVKHKKKQENIVYTLIAPPEVTKWRTSLLQIQDVQPNFWTNPPPPTGQTEHARGLKFCMGSPHGSVLRVTEAIFDKSPLSRDMGVGRGTLREGQ